MAAKHLLFIAKIYFIGLVAIILRCDLSLNVRELLRHHDWSEVSVDLPEGTPKILLWTPVFNRTHYSRKFNAIQCEYKCHFANRYRLMEREADALIFHMRDIPKLLSLGRHHHMPRYRREDQVYVAFNLESPLMTGEHNHNIGVLKPMEGITPDYFNATLDYRQSASYFHRYGSVKEAVREDEMEKLKPIGDKEWNKIVSKKKHLALGIISNCETYSKREMYIEKLREFIPLTLVGECYGNDACAKNKSDVLLLTSDGCEKRMIESHYFYLAFENAICKDYVTEKFWRIKKNIVPIVLRRRILQGIAHDSSFIAADDFDSPAGMAAHLRKVARNEKMYRRYFEWRETHYEDEHRRGVCELCRDLHLKRIPERQPRNIYEYYSENQCEESTAVKLLKGQGKY